MDVKSYVDVVVTKNDRVYHFYMPVGAPFGEAYDASFEVLSGITEMAKQAAENARPKDVDATPTEAVPAEIVS
jgi:hypothetical protein